MRYYEWLNSGVQCPECGWCGLGSEAATGEIFDDGVDRHCPSCSHRFGYLGNPTSEEMRSDPRATATDRVIAEMHERRWSLFSSTKLVEPAQLPDIDPPPTVLHWYLVASERERDWVVIRQGDREIWRELSWYENADRFCAIAEILGERYGRALQDLVPTKGSSMSLHGDHYINVIKVQKARDWLKNRAGSDCNASDGAGEQA